MPRRSRATGGTRPRQAGPLGEYHRKRDFGVTPEPRGAPSGAAGRSFVVQKHAARQLHYDFRLEMDGVLRSWSVPKGPSLDPRDKRLAVETEDHPVEYGEFEGVIPAGEYGGGSVAIWDRGTWEPQADASEGYRKGALRFRLQGEKLRGGFVLARMKKPKESKPTWLLIKSRDEFAREGGAGIIDERPESVATGRTVEDIAAARDRVWHSNRERPAKMSDVARPAALDGAVRQARPVFVPPALATLTVSAPEGDGWLHEMKFDGYRILALVVDGEVRLLSRNGKDWTAALAEVAGAVEALGLRHALVDGEAAVLLPDGTTRFQALQNRMSESGPGELVYFVFDLLHLDGYDLRPVALEARKRRLRELLATRPDAARAGIVRYSDHLEGRGAEFFESACRRKLEGIISKRRAAPYRSGRGLDWLKVKCLLEQEVVIGGMTPPAGSRVGLGALLVGVHDESGRLRYAGKVGTGFTDASLRELRARLGERTAPESPFSDRVPGAGKVTWARPDLVAQVAFTEWTNDGRMRHPSFRGLRADKPAREVVRERPLAASPTKPGAPRSRSK
jgi:bifunctional non-homologous end joining protein LigD